MALMYMSVRQTEFAGALRDMLKRQKRVRVSVMFSLAGLALASIILAVFADIQTGRAKANESLASTREFEAKESEKQAKEEKRIALEQAAALALDTGVQLCEQGRSRLGILAIAYSLQICPADAPDLRRVILTNLAGWGTNLMYLVDAKTFPGQAVATDRDGRFILMQNPDDTVQLYSIDTGRPTQRRNRLIHSRILLA